MSLEALVARLRACNRCPRMVGPVVTGRPVASPVMLIGQAPGGKEGVLGRPFAWTAGKTMFKWFSSLGLEEEAFRERVYMAAVCRCFPGKSEKGGDRVPDADEVAACARWMEQEMALLRPRLVLPVGKLAIEQLMPVARLNDCVGRRFRVEKFGHAFDAVPLPHPSGASTWHRLEPGKTLLAEALDLIAAHEAFREIFRPAAGGPQGAGTSGRSRR